MKKHILLTITLLIASATFAKNLSFYRLNPAELEKAIKQCPTKHPSDISCAQLYQLATHTNQLVSELQYNPQFFGQKILALQEALMQAPIKAKNESEKTGQQIIANDNKMQLRERLAIVKWLESPRG